MSKQEQRMALKSSSGKSQKAPPPRSGASKTRGELEAKDLDKVTGGLRATGGGKKTGDPCDGGE
jgi:hypothetical protein